MLKGRGGEGACSLPGKKFAGGGGGIDLQRRTSAMLFMMARDTTTRCNRFELFGECITLQDLHMLSAQHTPLCTLPSNVKLQCR